MKWILWPGGAVLLFQGPLSAASGSQAQRLARVDGSTFGWYSSGLVAGRSLRRNFLPQVQVCGGSNPWNPSMRDPVLANKAKIVDEFDAADIPGSYIYPAMARSFRTGVVARQGVADPETGRVRRN